MKHISKKEEQHRLSSQWLHEVVEWEPPRFRRKKPPAQLPGQLDIVEPVEDDQAEAS